MDSKSSGRRNESEHARKPTPSIEISSPVDRMERKRHSSSLTDYKDEEREDYSSKKPHLTVDTSPNCQPLCEALSSNDSFYSGVAENDGVPMASGLSAYLEDIVSDEEPLEEPPASPQATPMVSDSARSKEELLQLMERVDREITTAEQQITILEKKQEENSTISLTAPISSIATPSLTSATPTSLIISSSSSSVITSSAVSSSSSDHTHLSSAHQQKIPEKRSLIDTIYNENRLKALNSQIALFGGNEKLAKGPLYYQPSDISQFMRNRERHKVFFPRLVSYLKKKKIEKHHKELALCEEYESVYSEWEKRLERWTHSLKKKNRDSRSKELFEKVFPELRSKRDQLRDEAYSRVGVRSFGVVRSEAELNQLAYELYEQDEAKGRWQLTHAVLPPMMIDKKERRVQFVNNNGLLTDPMAVHRATKTVHSWTDEEKTTFKEKFALFPKNFEKIASFLPNKSMNECVRYYYLVKKKENFKQLIRRSSFKRRRLSKHHSGYPINSGLHSSSLLGKTKPRLSSSDGGHSCVSPSVLTSPTSLPSTALVAVKSPPRVPDYDGWTDKEIASLKEGLCKYGRAWGKVYREVGGGKSATQCKQFYDTYCTDETLQLNNALAEHSSKKNAEKVKKKMAEIKKASTLPSPASVKKTSDKKPHPLAPQGESEEESEGSESEDEDEEEEEETDSETTLTDSGSEELKPKDFKPLRFSSSSLDHVNPEPLQSPLDIFLSAAEALSNTVPVEIALHDHTYSRPPMDLQGSSGLQLIAAAAAVVSPGLAKTASSSSGKSSGFSLSNKAPRGRPPSQQKRGSGYPHQKLAPTFLTPTSGTSHNINLDLKPTLRARSRSAPTDKLRPQVPLTAAGKNLVTYPQVPTGKGHHSHCITSGSGFRGSTSGMAGKDINLIANSGILRSSSSPASSSSSSSSSVPTSTSLIGVTNGHNSLVDGVSASSPTVHTHVGSDGISRLSYPLVSSSSSSKSHQRRDGPVFELNLGNLGNMALLLAATGSNQQAALLLPPSTILNKQTLAMLQGGSVCLSDSGSSTTFSIDTSSLTTNGGSGRLARADHKELTSLSVGKGGVLLSTTPTPSSVGGSVKGSVPLHFSTSLAVKDVGTSMSPLPATLSMVKNNSSSNPVIYNPSSSSEATVPVSAGNTKQDGPLRNLATPTTTPTSPGDFSNLNLLSNLVAGLSKKPDHAPHSVSSVVTTPTTPPTKPNLLNFRKATDEKVDLRRPPEGGHRLAPPTSSSYQTISSQQSLMLYARSLAMPLNSSSTSSPEEIDHLEYATRGISELSKLLGGADNGLDAAPPSKVASWSPDELLCNPFGDQATPTSVHTITTSLTATTTDLLAPPPRQLSLSNRTPTPINALAEEKS